MKYQSTRGKVKGLSFKEVLMTGFASDGGMLLPESIPVISKSTLLEWSKLSYKELAKKIVALYVEDEIPSNDLDGLMDAAYTRFTHPEVVGLKHLSNGLSVMEMFHGRTLSFKDYSMSCVSSFMNYFLHKDGQHITAIVATSGDTGSAAIDSVLGLENVDVIVLTPMGRVSPIQELFMTTVIADNVHVFRIDGTSDDLDIPMKNCFVDEKFASQQNICSVNSVNWARVMVQMTHYFYAYFKLNPSCDGAVEIVVPSGGGGNCTAGVIARMMGLPLKITCAVNINSSFAELIRNGSFHVNKVVKTLAPAMDIQIPYNAERILYLLSGRNSELVCQMYEQLEKKGQLIMPSDLHDKVKEIFSSFVASDDLIKEVMKKCWEEENYQICPHTATAVAYHYSMLNRGQNSPARMCVATASPAKFDEALLAAGLTPLPNTAVINLHSKPTKYVDVRKDEDWDVILRAKISEINHKWQNSDH